MQEPFSGMDAIASAAKDVKAQVITYVPGYPITELAEALKAEIAVNEKVALEIALGASATGSRSIVIVKQVGMNILADPLAISATHRIGSGMVVIAGDDLGPKGSQTEMDSRFYGPLAKLPVLDPRDCETLYNSVLQACVLSERLRIPAIVRVTSRLLASSSDVPYPCPQGASSGPLSCGAPFQTNKNFIDLEGSSWDLTARGRLERHRREILPLAQEACEATSLNSVQIGGDVGIIASGYPAKLAEGQKASLLAVGYAYPLPLKLIRRFIDGHKLVLIAEEPEPFIESQLMMSPKVRGKLTGRLPYGQLERSDLLNALENLECEPEGEEMSYESARKRGFSGICDDCPFIPLFRALAKIDVPVAGDAGCAIRATREPYRSVDVVYGLGSSIGVASGFRMKGVAVIGDFAFAHTGLPALVNALERGRKVLVILLQNGIAATTGGQEAPDMTGLLETLVPTRSILLPASEEEIEGLIREELARSETSAVVARGSCARQD